MKHDNRGLTLIELIIAIAISTIIFGAATLFISNAMRSYETAESTIDLQMEAHVMMEQVGGWIMEGNRICIEDSVTVDMGAASSTVDNVLVIYKIPRTSDLGRLPTNVIRDESGRLTTNYDPTTVVTVKASKRLIWMQNGKLFMKVVDGIEDYDSDVTVAISGVDEQKNCICDYMEIFSPDWDAERGTVKVAVTLKEGVQEYTLNNEFKVRNEIMEAASPAP